MFDSDVEDFFLAHFGMSGASTEVARAKGPTGLRTSVDITTRLADSSVISVAKIRCRARGIGSEFALACDLRFASQEKAILGQPEVGAGVIPGGGAIERLSSLVGRGRALELIIGADDYYATAAERYGYVNRAVPDAELDQYVDALARRIAPFGRQPIAAAKTLANRTTLPEVRHLIESQGKVRRDAHLAGHRGSRPRAVQPGPAAARQPRNPVRSPPGPVAGRSSTTVTRHRNGSATLSCEVIS